MTDDAMQPEAREELPQVTQVRLIEAGSRAFLVLQVNIEGRDHRVALETSALPKAESTSPAPAGNLVQRVDALQEAVQNHNRNFQEVASFVNEIPGVRRRLRFRP